MKQLAFSITEHQAHAATINQISEVLASVDRNLILMPLQRQRGTKKMATTLKNVDIGFNAQVLYWH